MDYIEKLKKLDTKQLIDVVKNHKQYDYHDDIREAAIYLLHEKGWTREDLRRFGHLNNVKYEWAEKEYKAFLRNTKISFWVFILKILCAFISNILCLVILTIICFVFVYLAYCNRINFYKALGKKDEDIWWTREYRSMSYWHLKNKMKEELKGYR